MTSTFADIALAVGNSQAASLVAKATVILALALVGVRLARRSSAAVRHVLLAAAFAMLLALPMTSMLVRSVRLVEVPIVTSSAVDSPSLSSRTGSTPRGDRVSAVFRERATIPPSRVSASVILLAIWAAVALLFLMPVFFGLWHMRKLRLGRPWRHGQVILRKLVDDVGVRRPVEVLLHGAVSGPGSCGTLRPVIVLPMDAPTWREDDLSRAIIHELEHVRRGDWVSQCFARAVCACYWFHPLVWIAWRQLVLEAERACDDAVLRCAEPTAYALQLVALAERKSNPSNLPLLTLANRTELATRVAAVLDSRQQRGRASIVCLALACVASILLVVTISPFRIVTAAQTQEQTQTFSGSLTDPLGRTLPDAKLTLWNTSTQQSIETRSDGAGHFKFSGIPVGSYRLQVAEFGSQGQISLAHGQHLARNIALAMGEMNDTLTVHSNDAPAVLPPLPAPLPPPSQTSEPYPNQADASRCAQVSMFCRVMPPVQIARIQPIYPAKQRASGIAGTVVVEGRVGTDGLIKDLHAIPPADTDFASSTFDALRRWQFTPIRLDGVPVDTNIRVTAHFVIQ